MTATHWYTKASALALTAAVSAGCASHPIHGPDPVEVARGLDVSQPFPIDRGDDGSGTPSTYRGLWLRLVDNGATTRLTSTPESESTAALDGQSIVLRRVRIIERVMRADVSGVRRTSTPSSAPHLGPELL